MKTLRHLTAFFFVIIALVFSAFSQAEYQPLDHIVAIVNDDVIMASQLQERTDIGVKRLKEAGMPIPDAKTLTRQVLDQLILEDLQLQLGRRMGVRISEQELNQAVANIAKNNRLTLGQFQKRLGPSYLGVRNQIRKEMIIARVRQLQVSERIRITDQDVENYLNSKEGQQQTRVIYRLAHILIAVPEAASPEQWQKAEVKANNLVDQLRKNPSIKNFQKQAIQSSDAQTALKGGDLGWRSQDQLPSLFATVVPKMKVGEIAGPLRSGSGFNIVALVASRGAHKVMQAQAKVRHILIKSSAIVSESQAKEMADQLYRKIKIEGDKEFPALAAKYSEDIGSKVKGGELGWMNVAQFDPVFAKHVMQAPLNQVIKPFRTQFGWHVIEVQGRRNQDMSQEAINNQVRRLLFGREYEESLQTWLQRIRSEAYVEIKK